MKPQLMIDSQTKFTLSVIDEEGELTEHTISLEESINNGRKIIILNLKIK